jgi:hypothetical protein
MDAIASIQIDEVTVHCYFVSLGPDELPTEKANRLDARIAAFAAIEKSRELTPREIIKSLFAK